VTEKFPKIYRKITEQELVSQHFGYNR